MWFNPIMRWLLRSPIHFLVSRNMMLMTYTGRKSGKTYTTPMNYLKIQGVYYTISSRDRVWWRNLRGGAQVTLRLQGEDIPAWAECIEDQTEVVKALHLYLKSAPQLARYMNVDMNSQGVPNPKQVELLAADKVIILTRLK